MIRATAWAGIAWFLLSTSGILLLVIADLPERAMEAADVPAVLGAFAQQASLVLSALTLLLLSIICAGVFGVGVTRLLEPAAAIMGLTRAVFLIGITLFLFETLISVSLVQIAATPFENAAQDERLAWEIPLRVLMQVRNNGALLGSTLLSLSAILMGLGIASGVHILPKWGGWLVFISGLLGLAGSLTPLLSAVSSVRQAGLFGFALWGMITGFGLLRCAKASQSR